MLSLVTIVHAKIDVTKENKINVTISPRIVVYSKVESNLLDDKKNNNDRKEQKTGSLYPEVDKSDVTFSGFLPVNPSSKLSYSFSIPVESENNKLSIGSPRIVTTLNSKLSNGYNISFGIAINDNPTNSSSYDECIIVHGSKSIFTDSISCISYEPMMKGIMGKNRHIFFSSSKDNNQYLAISFYNDINSFPRSGNWSIGYLDHRKDHRYLTQNVIRVDSRLGLDLGDGVIFYPSFSYSHGSNQKLINNEHNKFYPIRSYDVGGRVVYGSVGISYTRSSHGTSGSIKKEYFTPTDMSYDEKKNKNVGHSFGVDYTWFDKLSLGTTITRSKNDTGLRLTKDDKHIINTSSSIAGSVSYKLNKDISVGIGMVYGTQENESAHYGEKLSESVLGKDNKMKRLPKSVKETKVFTMVKISI